MANLLANCSTTVAIKSFVYSVIFISALPAEQIKKQLALRWQIRLQAKHEGGEEEGPKTVKRVSKLLLGHAQTPTQAQEN